MLIKMLETRRGSEDGFVVRRFMQGETYDVADSLAKRFLNDGWAYNAEPEAPASSSTASGEVIDALAQANRDFNRIFGRTQNPATLATKGEL